MTTNQTDLDALYEISLSISPSGTLEETANRALSAYVEGLDCSAGAVFETIQEPLVNVVYREGEPVVTRINDAFEETFGYDRSEAIGSSINDLIVPDDEEFRETTAQIDDRARQGEYMHQEVQRETITGTGDFLLRGVPVEATDEQEHFAMYIDITEEKERRRKLERLYDETEAILSASDREEICARTVTAATDILGSPLIGVYLYDRREEALTAVSTTGGVDVTFGGGGTANVHRGGDGRLGRLRHR